MRTIFGNHRVYAIWHFGDVMAALSKGTRADSVSPWSRRSVQTTERNIGCRQNFRELPEDFRRVYQLAQDKPKGIEADIERLKRSRYVKTSERKFVEELRMHMAWRMVHRAEVRSGDSTSFNCSQEPAWTVSGVEAV
jgi:hypothetical protein